MPAAGKMPIFIRLSEKPVWADVKSLLFPLPFRLRFPPSNKVPRLIWALQNEERKKHKKAEVKSFSFVKDLQPEAIKKLYTSEYHELTPFTVYHFNKSVKYF
jgi:hypothetical protein